MSQRRCFVMLRPRDSALARALVTAMGREDLLDVLFVQHVGGVGFTSVIPGSFEETASDRKTAVSAVSDVLREHVTRRLPSMEAWIGGLVTCRGVGEDEVAPEFESRRFERVSIPDGVRAAASTAMPAREARRELLKLITCWKDALPDAVKRAWLLELHEWAPDEVAGLASGACTRLGSALIAGGDKPEVRRAFTTFAAHLDPTNAARLLRACDRSPHRASFVDLFVAAGGANPLESLLWQELSDATREQLYPHCTRSSRVFLAQRRAVPLSLVRNDPDPEVRTYAARFARGKQIDETMRDASPVVLAALYENGSRSQEQGRALAARVDPTDEADVLALAVATHPELDAEVALRLAGHVRVDVREALAGREDAPQLVLERLSMDPEPSVRRAVATQGDLPEAVRAALRVDAADSVRLAVTWTDPEATDTKPEAMETDARRQARLVFLKTTRSAEVLRAYARDEDAQVRCAVAAHPHTPPGVLEQLSASENGYLREAVASNPLAPEAVLARLASDPVPPVRRAAARSLGKRNAAEKAPRSASWVAKNSRKYDGLVGRGAPPAVPALNAPRETVQLASAVEEVLADPLARSRRELARQANQSFAVLSALVDDPDLKVRMQLVRSVSTPPELLHWLAADPDEEVRCAVAASPRASRETLALLASDDRVAVRRAVRARRSKPSR